MQKMNETFWCSALYAVGKNSFYLSDSTKTLTINWLNTSHYMWKYSEWLSLQTALPDTWGRNHSTEWSCITCTMICTDNFVNHSADLCWRLLIILFFDAWRLASKMNTVFYHCFKRVPQCKLSVLPFRLTCMKKWCSTVKFHLLA